MPLPTDSKARKDTPIFSGVLRYFPLALAEVAKLSLIGNDKHNPGEPLNWSRGKSTDHGDCLVRHQMDAGTIDPDTITARFPEGLLHDVHVAWRALAQLQVALEAKQAEPDIRDVDVTPTEPRCPVCSARMNKNGGAHYYCDKHNVLTTGFPFPPAPDCSDMSVEHAYANLRANEPNRTVTSGIGVSWSGNGRSTIGAFPATETI